MLKIRPPHVGDATKMLLVHREAVFVHAASHYPQGILEAWSRGATPDRVASLEQEISDPNLVIFVAEFDKDLIGFAIAYPLIKELRAVYVKPNSVGGVGRALLVEAEKQAFIITESLTCDASLNAEKFYNANGYTSEFQTEHVLKTGDTMSCIRMKKIRPNI